MSKTTEARLVKLGYRTDLESLSESLPKSIWITKKEGKNFNRKPVSFVITRHDSKWVVTLTTVNDQTGEVYILHRVVGDSLKDSVSEMLLFLEDNKMLQPNI